MNQVIVSQVKDPGAEGFYVIIPMDPSILKEHGVKPEDFMNFLRFTGVHLLEAFLIKEGKINSDALRDM